MKKELGEKLFLIKWLADYQIEITNGYQIEAIQHSEKKWYNGEHQMIILRESTEEDLKRYPVEI